MELSGESKLPAGSRCWSLSPSWCVAGAVAVLKQGQFAVQELVTQWAKAEERRLSRDVNGDWVPLGSQQAAALW